MMKSNKIIAFCDGACLGNPGPGGAASLVADDSRVLELGVFDPNTTNNRMEIFSVTQVLRALSKFKGREIHFYCDSQYVLNGAEKWVKAWKRNGWKTAEGGEVKNRDLWQELSDLIEGASREFLIFWHYVPGHSGVPGNERVDFIATTLASGQELFLYDGSRSAYEVDLENLKATKTKSSSKTAKTTPSTYYLSLVGGAVYRDKTWKECEARVKGVRAAKYKKVNSPGEEAEVLLSWGVANKNS
jgi:ribonuclease HI